MIKKFDLYETNNYGCDAIYVLSHHNDWVGYYVTEEDELIDLAKCFCDENGIEAMDFELDVQENYISVYYREIINLDGDPSRYKDTLNFQKTQPLRKYKQEKKKNDFNL